MKSIKSIILIISLISGVFLLNTATYAIKSNKNKSHNNAEHIEMVQTEKTNKPLVANISFEQVLDKAKVHSYDIKIADFDVLISKQDITIARSEYMPKLYFGANNEYNKNFHDYSGEDGSQNNTSSYVGDTFVNPYTRFQSLLGITLSYNVFDFGVRKEYLDMAKEDVDLKKKLEKQTEQELYLTMIDTYTRIGIIKQNLDINEKILELSEKNLDMKQRLFDVKEISKIEINEQKVEIEKVKNNINELKMALAEMLNLLGFYTGENYDLENLSIQEIQSPDIDAFAFTDYTKSLIWDIQESVINKKLHELKITKRANYPKLNLYSRYYWYGSDENNYAKAWKDIKQSNVSVGLSLNAPLFDGMKNSAEIKKAKLECMKVEVSRDKAIAEFANRLSTMRSKLVYTGKLIDNNETIIKKLTEQTVLNEKLLKQKIISPIDKNASEIALLREQAQYSKNKMTQVAILKSIQVLTTYEKD